MTDSTPELTEEEQEEARTAWLLRLSPEQAARFDAATILDWLDARREQRIAGLRAACQTLREESARRQQIYARLIAALTQPAA